MSDERDTTPPGTPESPVDVHGFEQLDQVLAFLYSWNKWISKQKGEWKIDAPMIKEATAVYLEERVVPDLQRARAGAVPKNVDSINPALNPCMVCVDGIDREPGKPSVYTVGGGRRINTYAQPDVPAIEGEFPNLLRVIRHLTAKKDGTPDDAGAEWLLNWCAQKFQNPGSNQSKSVVITGEQGNGKNTVAEAFMMGLGRKNCRAINQDVLEDKFNAYYADKLFVFADDCIPRNSMRDLAPRLKTAVTSPTVAVNQKNAPVFEMKNRSSWLFAANTKNPILVEPGDRRYSIFSNHTPVTDEWKNFLRSFWLNGKHAEFSPTDWFKREVSAFRWHMENAEIDYDLISKPHESDAREELITLNLPSEEDFKREATEVGFKALVDEFTLRRHHSPKEMTNDLLDERPKPEPNAQGEYRAGDVYRVYKVWCRERGRTKNQISATALGLYLKSPPNEWYSHKSSGIWYRVPPAPPAGGVE